MYICFSLLRTHICSCTCSALMRPAMVDHPIWKTHRPNQSPWSVHLLKNPWFCDRDHCNGPPVSFLTQWLQSWMGSHTLGGATSSCTMNIIINNMYSLSLSLSKCLNNSKYIYKYPPSHYPGGVVAPHFVSGPTPNPTKWFFFPLQNGNAAQKHYKMAVPSPPWPDQILRGSCQHIFWIPPPIRVVGLGGGIL